MRYDVPLVGVLGDLPLSFIEGGFHAVFTIYRHRDALLHAVLVDPAAARETNPSHNRYGA